VPRDRRLKPMPKGPVDDNIRALDGRLGDIEDSPLAAPRDPREVVLATGDNLIRHGLRRARGRLILSQSAAVTLYDVPTADPEYWIINSSGPATVSLLFF
jgi:hypothetical protein